MPQVNALLIDAWAGRHFAQLHSKLLEIDPQAKVIVSSGYANDPVLAEFSEFGFSGRIAKPCTVEKLSHTLDELIAGKPVKARRTRDV